MGGGEQCRAGSWATRVAAGWLRAGGNGAPGRQEPGLRAQCGKAANLFLSFIFYLFFK